MGNHRLALFLKQFDQALLLFDQRVDAGGFVVEEAGDLGLLDAWWPGKKEIFELLCW
ncbi:hypothetical protein D3C85_1940130 [compost metagenome]